MSRPLPVAHFLLKHKADTSQDDVVWFNGILEIDAELARPVKRKRISEQARPHQPELLKLLSMKVPVTNATRLHNSFEPVTNDGEVKQCVLGELACCISSLHIGRIAVMYFGYDHSEIQTLERSHREDQWGLIFEVLLGWQRRNPGPNQRYVSMTS